MNDARDSAPLLSVIMPVYNEAGTVETIVDRVRSAPLDAELICIDDGSTDGTADRLERLLERGRIHKLIRHETNLGKGAAVRTGIARASGRVVVIQDADLEYDPEDLPRLLGPILEGKADAVYGSRFLGGPHRVLYFWHRLGNGVLTFFSNMLTDLNLTDMETCYKLIRADLAKRLPLRSDRFGIEPELTARLAQAKARIYELPIGYHGRTYSEGKKINWKDGIAAFWHIARCNLLPPKAEPWSASGSGSGSGSDSDTAAGAARRAASAGVSGPGSAPDARRGRVRAGGGSDDEATRGGA